MNAQILRMVRNIKRPYASTRPVVDPSQHLRQTLHKINYKCSKEALSGNYRSDLNRQLEKLRVYPRVTI